MMCWMNFWCGLFYVPFLFGLTNTGRELLAFCIQYPEVGWRKSCRQWHPISLMQASFTVVPALVAREGCRCMTASEVLLDGPLEGSALTSSLWWLVVQWLVLFARDASAVKRCVKHPLHI